MKHIDDRKDQLGIEENGLSSKGVFMFMCVCVCDFIVFGFKYAWELDQLYMFTN